jgi:hypothetical protein
LLKAILQSAIYVHVTEAITSNQDRICFIRLAYKGGIKRLEWLNEELVEPEAACD